MRRTGAKTRGRGAAGQWAAGLALLALVLAGVLALGRLTGGTSVGASIPAPAVSGAGLASASATVSPPPAGSELVALVTVNVRVGPGVQFPIVGVVAAGNAAPILAVAPDGRWWQIECPLAMIAPECWVTSDPLFVRADVPLAAPDAAAAVATPTPPPVDGKPVLPGATPTRPALVETVTPTAAPALTATPVPGELFTPTPVPTLTPTSVGPAQPTPTLTSTATGTPPTAETPTVEPPTQTPTPTATATNTATPPACTITADPLQLDVDATTELEIHAPGAESLRLEGAAGVIADLGPVAEVVRYTLVLSAALFGEGDAATVTATARYAGGATAVCSVEFARVRSAGRSVSVVAAHGEGGYTAAQVMTSYGLDYIPPYVMTAGPQTLQVHLASLQLGGDRSVALLGGQQLASIPFTALADGSVGPISFTVPQGQVLLLQVGDAQGRHFDTSRYLPVPYVAHSGDVAVLAFRDPGGIWHFRMEGSFELGRSQDLIYMSEVASRHLARVVGGTVLDNDVGRALARQAQFGLWQLPGAGAPDGPWATQYMAAQCGQRMVYDPNVVPPFVRVTGTNQFEDLRTPEEFDRSLRSFPPPPNAADKFGPWYCTEVTQTWQAPAVGSEP